MKCLKMKNYNNKNYYLLMLSFFICPLAFMTVYSYCHHSQLFWHPACRTVQFLAKQSLMLWFSFLHSLIPQSSTHAFKQAILTNTMSDYCFSAILAFGKLGFNPCNKLLTIHALTIPSIFCNIPNEQFCLHPQLYQPNPAATVCRKSNMNQQN